MRYKNTLEQFGTVAEQIAKAARERRAEFYEDTRTIVSRAFDAQKEIVASELAKKIIAAAARARGETASSPPKFTDSEAGRRARAIVNAARRARGEDPL